MDEYIEREALMKNFCGYDLTKCVKYGNESAEQQHESYSTMMMYEIADEIEDAPAADVAPVRHARWVDNHCTACGMMPMGDEMWKHLDLEPPLFERFMDYCPSCGCRMDG